MKDSSGFDFESNTELNLLVKVEDDHVESMADSATISVQIQDVLEFTDGLIAYYPFNSNANDESGNEIQGLVNGALPTTDRFENASGGDIVWGGRSLEWTQGLKFHS